MCVKNVWQVVSEFPLNLFTCAKGREIPILFALVKMRLIGSLGLFFLTAVYLDLGIFLANNSCIVLRLSEKLARFSFDPVHPWSGNYLARVRVLFLTTISFFPFTEMP